MSDRLPEVELLWWEGCPSWEQAQRELRETMQAVGLDPDSIRSRRIDTEEEATASSFPGSPTIRIDGEDVQDPGEQPVGLTCRIYRLRDGRISALPDPEDVQDRLRAAIDAASG